MSRDLERREDELLAEQIAVRTEGHAPAPPAPGLNAAELEHKLLEVRRYVEGGEIGIASDMLAALIDRLQTRPRAGEIAPVTVVDFLPSERQRHQRAALRAVIASTPDAALDELIAAVEAGF